ncbi:hypothetical protein KY331_04680 [Candidatus Woesearchaeota archaeon]|nr:hypothetical protein [Candidatus Woesearchaeota archaeon]
MSEMLDRIKKYFSFDIEELKSVAVGSLIIGFMISFGEWGVGKFDFFYGLYHLVGGILIAAASILFHVSAQKILGLRLGFTTKYKMWWYGLLIGLIITFITNGKIWWIIIPGGVTCSIIGKYRLGKFRYGLNYIALGFIGIIGPLASIIFGTIFKNLDIFLSITHPLINKIFIFNLVYAICTMLPIPPLDGHLTFFASRVWYVFLFSLIFVYAVLIILFSIYSWIIALAMGGLIVLLYYIFYERLAWPGP